jgi:hypothetical protein
MTIRSATILFVLSVSCAAQAQQPAQAATAAEPTAGIDDVVIVNGWRYPVQLRLAMLDAERKVYDIFNQFNDEAQFELECGRRNVRGTRLQTQDCVPVFERQALANEARSTAEVYQAALGAMAMTQGNFAPGAQSLQGSNTEQFTNFMPMASAPPAGGVIRAGQARLQRKMQEIAATHPEFVEAIVSYVESRQRYNEALERE